MPEAEILTIGDELLSGETADTNSCELDGYLVQRGWIVTRHTTVPDDVDVIAEAFTAASARAQLVISSGGLGPTADDLTLEALAHALGCGLRLDEATWTSICDKFARLGRAPSPNNQRQARVPEIGSVIDNQVGTAPAFTARLGDADVYLLPGVPREMRWLMDNEVGARVDRGEPVVQRRTVRVVGLGESRLEHTIRSVVKRHREHVQFGFRALGIENHVKMMVKGASTDALDAAEADLRESLEGRVFGVDDQTHADAVAEHLIARGDTVAAAESCTGGLIAKRLTDVAGSSAYFVGGVVAYANEVKVDLLGVSAADLDMHGAVSDEVAQQMARGVRDRFGTTWGVSTTGIAGPSGGSEGKPVGLVFLGLAGPDGVSAARVVLPGDRAQVRSSAAMAALEQLRRALSGDH